MSNLDIDLIRNYLTEVGGKIEYPILVNAFKQYLYNEDPKVQAEIRTSFKDHVNRLATVSIENNKKFMNLRPEFRPQPKIVSHHQSKPLKSHQEVLPPLPPPHRSISQETAEKKQPLPQSPRDLSKQVINSPPPLPPPHQNGTSTPNSKNPPRPPPKETSSLNNQENRSNRLSMSAQMPPPRPPPRRRQSNASLFKTPARLTPDKSHELNDVAQKSPGKVREHASKINSNSVPSNLSSSLIPKSHSMRENRLNRESTLGSLASVLQRNGHNFFASNQSRSRSLHREDESDSSSLQPTIDPLRRRWVIEACNCNYNAMIVLLREDPKLASYKDIVNGYTALHWAAKFGNLDIIKLIAGTHQVSPNIKSSAGYTPLHVAYMFRKIEAANLLIKSYNANPFMRDHGGRRPQQLAVN